LSLAGLERITGVAQGQLSHYLTGRRNPSKKTVEKIQHSIHEFANELSQVKFV
jgi:transcriptional regulator with XRE-family HTH domain